MYTGTRSSESPTVHEHTWKTFSHNWHADAQQVVNWEREAPLRPPRPRQHDHRVFERRRSRWLPLSGGYAGATAAIRFTASCAATESSWADLERFGQALTPHQFGKAVVDLASEPNLDDTAYLRTTAGLATVS